MTGIQYRERQNEEGGEPSGARQTGVYDSRAAGSPAGEINTGMFRKLGFRSAHSPIQPGIQAISRMFGDGAREQIAMAANKMIAAAITKKRRAIAK